MPRLETSGYYALLLPLFAGLLGAEYLLGRRQRLYQWADNISNLCCGLGQLLVGILTGPVVLWVYDFTYRHGALLRWPEGSKLPWLIALFGVDFCYYWFHRSGHRIALLWTIHAVHHQSEEYNLSVALRQPWFSDLSALLFYWPLPLLGIAEGPFFVAVAVLSIYQVTLHTRLIGRPGAYGRWFNTPSHHRVHHGWNDRYRDKNFGATLIIWDRLFDTFAPEVAEEPVRYASPFGPVGHDPVGVQFRVLRQLLREARSAARADGWPRVFFGPPGSNPPSPPTGPVSTRALAAPGHRAAMIGQFFLILAGTVALLRGRSCLPIAALAIGVGLLLLAQAHLGARLDGRRREWMTKAIDPAGAP